jgi:hypothetical protein
MRSAAAALAGIVLGAGFLGAQEKKDAPKPVPGIRVFLPLGAAPGKTTRVTARGLMLDQASEVHFVDAHPNSKVALKSKGKAAVPKESDPQAVGDTEMELEITLAERESAEWVDIVAVTPAGRTEPHSLLVTPASRLVLEKEPNGGFATAQPVLAGQIVQGSIGQPRDVDVFKLEGRQGEKWSFLVLANRFGSALDPVLTLYRESGQILATKDDDPHTRDASLRVTLPADGAYFISLTDANDAGGPVHVYQLHIHRDP